MGDGIGVGTAVGGIGIGVAVGKEEAYVAAGINEIGVGDEATAICVNCVTAVAPELTVEIASSVWTSCVD